MFDVNIPVPPQRNQGIIAGIGNAELPYRGFIALLISTGIQIYILITINIAVNIHQVTTINIMLGFSRWPGPGSTSYLTLGMDSTINAIIGRQCNAALIVAPNILKKSPLAQGHLIGGGIVRFCPHHNRLR